MEEAVSWTLLPEQKEAGSGLILTTSGGFFIMFCLYIIYSQQLDRFYVGYTENIEKRLAEHNSGISDYTSSAQDWVLKYTEYFPDRYTAHQREITIKKKKSRKYIEWLISQG